MFLKGTNARQPERQITFNVLVDCRMSNCRYQFMKISWIGDEICTVHPPIECNSVPIATIVDFTVWTEFSWNGKVLFSYPKYLCIA